MPTKQVLKETYDRWYGKALIHLAKQEWEEARLCLNTATRALSDMIAKTPQGEAKTIQQDFLFDLATELDKLEKKTEMIYNSIVKRAKYAVKRRAIQSGHP